MLSFMLCQDMGLNLYKKAQKSSLEWWCHLYISRYYWTRSKIISCSLILGTKKCMLCCLLMFGGPKYDNHVIGFASSVRFVNIERKAPRYPQVCCNHYLLRIRGFDCSHWTLSLGYLYVKMFAKPFSPVLIIRPSKLS